MESCIRLCAYFFTETGEEVMEVLRETEKNAVAWILLSTDSFHPEELNDY